LKLQVNSLSGAARETGCTLKKSKEKGGEETTICELTLPLKFPIKRFTKGK
jgi:hypothetical protein